MPLTQYSELERTVLNMPRKDAINKLMWCTQFKRETCEIWVEYLAHLRPNSVLAQSVYDRNLRP